MNENRVLPETPWASAQRWRPGVLPLAVLTAALTVFGIGEDLMVSATLGSAPWTVLAQGVSLQTGINLAWATFGISALVLLLWLPLRQRPGLGTVLNMLLIAAALGATVSLLPPPQT